MRILRKQSKERRNLKGDRGRTPPKMARFEESHRAQEVVDVSTNHAIDSQGQDNKNSNNKQNHNPNRTKYETQQDKMSYKKQFVIGTLNVRGLNKKGKREEVIHLMEEMNVDILML